eukprot:2133794-Heterocapsa_arctica.AAC.1
MVPFCLKYSHGKNGDKQNRDLLDFRAEKIPWSIEELDRGSRMALSKLRWSLEMTSTKLMKTPSITTRANGLTLGSFMMDRFSAGPSKFMAACRPWMQDCISQERPEDP